MANTIVHFEIGCRDRELTSAFFSDLFGWQMEPMGPATMIHTGGDVGGHITAVAQEAHQYTIFYVHVEDISATLKRVEELGGKTLVPAVEIPSGAFAWFSDPSGNTIGLFQPKA
jgi:predicted enzyme related to lactoylglutathione lyase